jgi:hypothetical protein
MPARTELDRLADARPSSLDHPEWMVGPDAEDEILRQILSTDRAGASRRRSAARPSGHASQRRSRRPLIAIAAAAAIVAVAGGGAALRSQAGQPSAAAHRGPGHWAPAGTHLPPEQVMAALAGTATDAATRTAILYMRASFAPGTTVGGVAVMEMWTKGISNREKFLGASGGILDDESAVIRHGTRVRRFIDYTGRTWQTDSIAVGQYGPGPTMGQIVRQLLAPDAMQAPTVPGVRHPASPSRTITAVTVQGTRMILVTIRYPRSLASRGADVLPVLGSAEMIPGTAGHLDSAVVEQVWIDATSYLPVRAEAITAGGKILSAATYAWLGASPANRLVILPAPVPAGFRLTAEPGH